MKYLFLICILLVYKSNYSQVTFEIESIDIYGIERDSMVSYSDDVGPRVEFTCLLHNLSDSVFVLRLNELKFYISYFCNKEKHNLVIKDNIFWNDTLHYYLDKNVIVIPRGEKSYKLKFVVDFFLNNPWLEKDYLRILLKILPTTEIYLIDNKRKIRADRVLNVNIKNREEDEECQSKDIPS